VEQQKKDIFFTKCHISNKVCSIIIDNKSCASIAITTLVKKLNLNIIKHHRSYRLQWLNKYGEVKVTKHVFIFLRKHSIEVLCDVVHMDSSHLLLRRLWQYDRKAMHDGFRNKYTPVKNKKINHTCIIIIETGLRRSYANFVIT
jgi:hypothetical protein